jgi:hypothetical protein
MPHMPPVKFLDTETVLPDASSKSFWLKSSAWEIPNYGNREDWVEPQNNVDW